MKPRTVSLLFSWYVFPFAHKKKTRCHLHEEVTSFFFIFYAGFSRKLYID